MEGGIPLRDFQWPLLGSGRHGHSVTHGCIDILSYPPFVLRGFLLMGLGGVFAVEEVVYDFL